MSIQAVILGAGGYVGGELLRLLHAHPSLELTAAVSDSGAGREIGDVFPHLGAAYRGTTFVARDGWVDRIGDGSKLALFCAAPHGGAAKSIAEALKAAANKHCEVHVVDASADFRFADQSKWEGIYGQPHGAPDLLPHFTCAVPEHVDSVATPHVGHPGCFATASLLATVPLVRSGIVDGDIFIAGVTGSTGSGRAPQPGTHHPERNSNLYAYKPLSHRHAPEIAALAGVDLERVHFVPHSGPFARGIHVTVQASAPGVTTAQLRAAFDEAYRESVFVDVINGTPRIKDVAGSNRACIGVATDGGSVVVMAVIDNLVKGAAGGAVQWMNRLWTLPEDAGLDAPAPGWT